MEPATWIPVTVIALVLAHLLLLGYLSKRHSTDTASAGGDRSADASTTTLDENAVDHGSASPDSQARQDANLVRCRECEYRYCRHCVAELPGGTPIRQGAAGPVGGLG